MTKTLDDYMNDPDIAKMREPWREIHAIRLMQREKTKNMTFEERKAYYHERTKQFFASTGKTPKYATPYGGTDLAENGLEKV